MKKFFLLISVLMLAGCIEVGNFPEDRQKLHEMGSESDYCAQHPNRCYEGVQW